MGSTFEQLKKYAKRTAIILSLAVGLSCGLFIAGLLLLVFKLAEIEFPTLYTLLIGAGVWLVVWAILFLLLRKNENVLARELDKKFSLGERTQTMVDYKNADEPMVRLQRADAEEKLQARTGGTLKPKKIWAFATALGLSLALFVAGVAIPREKEGSGGGVAPFGITEWQLTAMRNLIAYVDQSKISQAPRDDIAVHLEELLAELCSVAEDGTITTLVTEEELPYIVKESITYVDTAIENYNTYKPLYLTVYMSDYAEVKSFAQGVANLDVTKRFEELRAYFVSATEDVAAVRTAVGTFATQLSAGFATAQVLQTDELLVQTLAFTTALSAIAQDTAQTYTELQTALDTAFTTAEDRINDALAQQVTNRDNGNYVIMELISIFNIKDAPQTGGEELPGVEAEQEENKDLDGAPPDPDKPKYGSDDVIYDPDQEKYVEYGDIYKEHSAIKDAQFKEDITDEELQDLIERYFEYLLGTAPKDEPTQEN